MFSCHCVGYACIGKDYFPPTEGNGVISGSLHGIYTKVLEEQQQLTESLRLSGKFIHSINIYSVFTAVGSSVNKGKNPCLHGT